jgi:hypothetical protein
MKPLAILVGLMMLAGGCSSGEKPVTLVVKEGNCYTLDGRLMQSDEELTQALIRVREDWPGKGLPEVDIRIDSPKTMPYADLARAILACGRADLPKARIEGVPLDIPPAAVDLVPSPPPFTPAFKPIAIHAQEDLNRFRDQSELFKGRGIIIAPLLDTPADLVVAAMKMVHEAGGTVGLAIPSEYAESGKPPITLRHAPLDKNGRFMFAILQLDLVGEVRSDSSVPQPWLPAPPEPSEDRGPPRIVYVVDRSGSLTDFMDYVKYALKSSIGDLSENDEFHVIFYSSGPPLEMPTRRLVPATERNKMMAFEFVDSIVPGGESDPSKAFERAFACRPNVIYFLTDGEVGSEIADLIKRLNLPDRQAGADKRVTVHAICFLWRMEGNVLQRIAEENGGQYRFISEKDLENLR